MNHGSTGGWQEGKKIILPLHAEEVHIEPGVQLVADITVHIEARHQQVMDALEQGVIDDPGRFRIVTDQVKTDRRTVKVSEYRQRRIRVTAVSITDVSQPLSRGAACMVLK